MSFTVGQAVQVNRNARWLWRSVKLQSPGVVTAIRTDRSRTTRYTVAFSMQDVPGAAVVIPRLRDEDLAPFPATD